MFQHVLVGIDFSPVWPVLRRRLAGLQSRGAQRVTLVYVLSNRYPATPEESHRPHYESRLAEEAVSLEEEGFQVDWQVRTGEPARELTAAALEVGADLVLLAMRGHSRLREFFVGSTALDAARLTRKPLWLEPVVDEAPAAGGALLLLTDGSEAARPAEKLFCALRDQFTRAAAATATCASEGCDREIADARAWLKELDEPDDGLEVRVLDGDPRQVLPALASTLPADLVVMGQRGRNALEKLLLGSTAEAVLRRAACPVLLVPRET